MSSKILVAYVDVRVFAHATEESDRVLAAAHTLLPKESVDTVVFKKIALTGHHGNPIVLFEAKIKDKKVAQKLLERLSLGLSVLDKALLNGEIRQHLENGNLYIRLDKQSAYTNEIKLSVTDPVHLRIHFKKHSPEEVIEICKAVGLLP